MKLKMIVIDPNDPEMEHAPNIQVALDGGCELPNCNCSPLPFLTVSNGSTLFSVELSREEAERIKGSVRAGKYIQIKEGEWNNK